MTFLGETEHFSGKNGALRRSILVGKQKHNVQKPKLVRLADLEGRVHEAFFLFLLTTQMHFAIISGQH